MSELARITSTLDQIDISKVAAYSEKIKGMTSLSQGAASVFLQDFIVAYDLTSHLLCIAMKCESSAKAVLEMERSKAYFDRAPEFLAENSVKDTSEARKKYEERDDQVAEAKDLFLRAEATTQLLKNKLMAFRYAYEAIKKMYFNNEGRQMPWEGM